MNWAYQPRFTTLNESFPTEWSLYTAPKTSDDDRFQPGEESSLESEESEETE